MADDKKSKKGSLRVKLISLGAVVCALVVPMVVYLAYDLIKTKMSPCGEIFQQTANTFESEIEFLKSKGKIVLGSNKVAELTERAQMTAINMETCCIVFGAGKRDPEKFLQCKASAREYDSNLKKVVSAVKQAVAAESEKASSAISKARRELDAVVKETQKVSKDFNKQLVQAKKNQVLEELKNTPPAEIKIEAQEKEPNSDLLNTNAINLGKWVTAAINANNDADFYAFVTPKEHRDWIAVELENRSTSLRPKLQLFNSEKKYLDERYNGTNGANLSYRFVAAPNTKYLLKVANYNNRSRGAYLVRVVPTQLYDRFEPNETILLAKPISLATPIQANLMDRGDIDYFKISTGTKSGTLTARLENRSTTLRPKLQIFDADKIYRAEIYNGTRGANLSLIRKNVKAGQSYFIRVDNYNNRSAGDYTLTVFVK